MSACIHVLRTGFVSLALIGTISAANGADAESTNAMGATGHCNANQVRTKRFMAAPWSSDEFDCATPPDCYPNRPEPHTDRWA